MRRTECKGAIDRLAVRLEYGLRTRPKPKKGVFGSEKVLGGTEAGVGGFLERFLKMRGVSSGEEGECGVVL